MKTIVKVLVIILLVTPVFAQSVHASADCPTTITWSGIDWRISDWAGPGSATPGFVFDPCNVEEDPYGQLVLTLENDQGVWKGAEISTVNSQSFGTYYVQVYSTLSTLPPSAVFGFFPYMGWEYDGTNEIDIEYSQWGDSSADNWNFTVYPATTSGVKDSESFGFSTEHSTTHSFVWSQDGIYFKSFTDLLTPPFQSTPFASWDYEPIDLRDIPQTSIPLLINLWAHNSGSMGAATEYKVVLSEVGIP